MYKKFIAGGCSFTFGHELSDDNNSKKPSQKTWAHLLKKLSYTKIRVDPTGKAKPYQISDRDIQYMCVRHLLDQETQELLDVCSMQSIKRKC